jgi:hypothetical protein
MTTESVVSNLLSRYGRLGAPNTSLRSPLGELGVGVVSRAQIVVDLESRYGIETHADDALGWATGQDIVTYIDHALGSDRAA